MNYRMKFARELAGLNRKQVSSELKVSGPTLSDWENGKKKPTLDNLKALSKLYNVNSDYLLGIEEEKFYNEEVSKKICEEITKIYNETPEKFSSFLVPAEVLTQILDGTYQFSTLTLPQFSFFIGKPFEKILVYLRENTKIAEEKVNETIRHYTEPIERQGKNIGIVPIKHKPLNNDLDELTQTMLELFCKLSTVNKCNVISYIEKLN